MARKFELSDDSVVVVIGSGAGGGTLSCELARKGINVVCFEAGPVIPTSEIVNDAAKMFGKLTWLDPRIGTGTLVPSFPILSGKGVGGTTLHWTASANRLLPHEFKPVTTYGRLEGSSAIDWPIGYEDIAPYYDRAESKMGVSGTLGRPPMPPSGNYNVLAAGARKVGYSQISTGTVAINSEPYDDRPACTGLGFCISGCMIDAKWTAANSEIPKALGTDHFELRPDSMVIRINHDARGRVSSVIYKDKTGTEHEQKARVVAVAGNSIDTARLLLVSSSGMYPHGLANSSGHVGRNFMRHMSLAVTGIMPGKVHWERGAQQAGLVKDETGHKPERGFAGGFAIELISLTPAPLAMFADAGGWGREYANDLAQFDRAAGMLIVGEDPAQERNGISLHPDKKDRYGLPVPVINYEPHANTYAMEKFAFGRGAALYEAIGATKIYRTPTRAWGAAHLMGTCRMSTNPSDGVSNKWGQSHDIPNLFVSDGSQFSSSGGENPTLTIVALAIRQADYLAEQLRTKAL
jgi:choline dehydrogenase-like flavoprotein